MKSIQKYLWVLFGILMIVLFFIGWKLFSNAKEGFDDLVPIQYVLNKNGAPTTELIPGYYKADDQFMRKIPYGYMIDVSDPMHILPKTNTALVMATGDLEYGTENIIEDGYYLTAGRRLAILPPGMYPDVSSVSYLPNPSTGVPTLKMTYRQGYISKERHLLASYPVDSTMTTLPPGFYYTDSTKSRISFLPEGAIIDTEKEWGYKYPAGSEPKSIATSNQALTYADISRNFIEYHKNVDEIKKQMEENGGTSLGGYMSITVRDNNGNLVQMAVPDMSYGLLGVDGEVYYKPGQYPYGSQNYVPSYEDYVYLSSDRVSREKQIAMAKYVNPKTAMGGFCESTKHSMIEREAKCNALDGNVCATTGCCVLFGGEKCVAGDANGPANKDNYKDLFVKNKDFYYFNSKCYGNCA